METEGALTALGRYLEGAGYRFVTITPASHARVLARQPSSSPDAPPLTRLRDVFGWSRSFERGAVEPEVYRLLDAASGVETLPDGYLRSRFRFSSVDERLYVHSAFPTQSADAVFFGPDTYRFIRFLRRHADVSLGRVVDIGAGSGAGGLALADRAREVVLTDINADALRCCRVNAALHGFPARVVESDLFAQVEGPIQLAVMNPPYLIDTAGRTYRDGGGCCGTGLAVRFVEEGLRRVAPGGQLLLYTGAPVREGRDLLRAALEPLLAPLARTPVYEELDVDVFGEELESPAYREIDRIAAVGLAIRVADARTAS